LKNNDLIINTINDNTDAQISNNDKYLENRNNWTIIL